MTNREFARLSEIIHVLTGIVLPIRKRQLVISRLRKRLRALKLDSFADYLAILDSEEGTIEAGNLVNVITTNLTSFFREKHHFDDLKTVLGDRIGDANKATRLRIWSAGCSTGEEPYSITMSILKSKLLHPGVNLKVLATDLDTDVLARARSAIYSASQIKALPRDISGQYFERLPDGQLRVTADVRRNIQFNKLNLHEAWPMKGPFDVIFCRNVLIYFDAEAKRTLIDRLVRMLRPGGTLYLGHSESMLGKHPQLENRGRTIFRKTT